MSLVGVGLVYPMGRVPVPSALNPGLCTTTARDCFGHQYNSVTPPLF